MNSISDIQTFVFQHLKTNLNPELEFHGYAHTKWVADEVKRICDFENIESKRAELVYVAALCHDTGYVIRPQKNEPEGAKYARKLMRKNGYNEKEIECATQCILETDPEVKCTSHQSEILSDADLGYIGTTEFLEWSNKLYKEYLNLGIISGDEKEWLKKQIAFFKIHRYHTPFSIKHRLPQKMKNLKYLQNQLEKIS